MATNTVNKLKSQNVNLKLKMTFPYDPWAVDGIMAEMILSMRPRPDVYLSIKGVRPLSKERPWWGGGLLPGTTQSRPAPLYAGRHS